MARPKKDGKRGNGVQGKKGNLYIVINTKECIDGKIISKHKWISTGLKDTPDNIKIAAERRKNLLETCSASDYGVGILVDKLVEIFLEKKKRELANTTYSTYEYRLKHVQKYLGKERVRNISKENVETFFDSLFRLNNVQLSYVKDIKRTFSTMMDFAVKKGLISKNPVKAAVINKVLANNNAKEKRPDEEFFSYQEALKFLDRIEEHPMYEMYYFVLFFGLRREEVLGIRWSAIDMENKRLVINHTVTKGSVINRANTTKSDASARVYPLNDTHIKMLNRLKEKEAVNRNLFGKEYFNSDYVFKHEDGTLYYPDYPSKVFKRMIKDNPDLPQGITLHGLRTSCVSILVYKKFDIKSVQKWVGHADVNTTLKIYAKVKEKEAKQSISDGMTSLIPAKKYE